MQRISNFIVKNTNAQLYQCCLCFNISHKIVRSVCPCRKYLCLECLKARNYCPICEVNIQVEPVQNVAFQFRCLSNSPSCQLIFCSEKDVVRHCTEQCLFMEQDYRRELLHIVNYQCIKGHTLEISNVHSLCTVCGSGRCKSRCATCMKQESHSTGKLSSLTERQKQRIGYCIQCRPIPCTTRKCTHNHDLVRTMQKSATCDLCDISARRYPLPVHGDRACDFDICSNCYKDLPQDHQLLPIRLPQREQVYDLN